MATYHLRVGSLLVTEFVECAGRSNSAFFSIYLSVQKYCLEIWQVIWRNQLLPGPLTSAAVYLSALPMHPTQPSHCLSAERLSAQRTFYCGIKKPIQTGQQDFVTLHSKTASMTVSRGNSNSMHLLDWMWLDLFVWLLDTSSACLVPSGCFGCSSGQTSKRRRLSEHRSALRAHASFRRRALFSAVFSKLPSLSLHDQNVTLRPSPSVYEGGGGCSGLVWGGGGAGGGSRRSRGALVQSSGSSSGFLHLFLAQCSQIDAPLTFPLAAALHSQVHGISQHIFLTRALLFQGVQIGLRFQVELV